MSKRGHSTSVGGKDYVLHINNDGTTLCNRVASRVNCGDGSEREEEICKVCWRKRRESAPDYAGHNAEKVWSVGYSPQKAIEAFCLARVGMPLEGEATPLNSDGDPRFDWGYRFTCDGTSFKAAGIRVPGGVVLTWWK